MPRFRVTVTETTVQEFYLTGESREAVEEYVTVDEGDLGTPTLIGSTYDVVIEPAAEED